MKNSLDSWLQFESNFTRNFSTDFWSFNLWNSNYEKSGKALDAFAGGPFAKNLRAECMNRTIRWNLEKVYPEETQIVGADVSFMLARIISSSRTNSNGTYIVEK